jgi:hypothetical protein
MTLREFLAEHDPDGTRTKADIEAVRDSYGNSPLVIVRYGRFAAVLALIPVDGEGARLCIDVHPFVNDLKATAGVFGMTRGRPQAAFPVTGTTSHTWNSSNLVAVLIGEQGEVPADPEHPLEQLEQAARATRARARVPAAPRPEVTTRDDEPLLPGPLPEELRVNGTVYVRCPD